MARDDAIAVVEASYDLQSDDDTWLRGVAQSLERLVKPSHGMLAYHVDSDETGVRFCPPVFVGGAKGDGAKIVEQHCNLTSLLERRHPDQKRDWKERLTVAIYEKVVSSALDEGADRLALSEMRTVGPRWMYTLGQPGVADLFWYANHHVDGNGLTAFVAGLDRKAQFREPDRRRYQMLSAHIKAALRLRRKLAPGGRQNVEAPRGGAILDADARVVHAAGEATEGGAVEQLRERARHIDLARSRKHGRGEDALEVWQGLVEGRWSLVEQFDADGKRFLLAHRNAEQVRDPRGLAAMETRVVGLAVRGYSDKLVAYHLGIPVGTASYHLTSAMRKLGVTGRTQLIRLLGRRFPQPRR